MAGNIVAKKISLEHYCGLLLNRDLNAARNMALKGCETVMGKQKFALYKILLLAEHLKE